MVVCVIALVVFAILGIFSAKYRNYAKEAFRCVARRLTLRPCDTGFDQKMKAKITGKLMKRSPKIAHFTFRHFEAISWLFTIMLVISIAITANSFWNLATTGSCDPHSDFCIFNPGAGISCGSEHCATEGCDCGGQEANCTIANNFSACDGNCTCDPGVCG